MKILVILMLLALASCGPVVIHHDTWKAWRKCERLRCIAGSGGAIQCYAHYCEPPERARTLKRGLIDRLAL